VLAGCGDLEDGRMDRVFQGDSRHCTLLASGIVEVVTWADGHVGSGDEVTVASV
jgi:hypothetical protein